MLLQASNPSIPELTVKELLQKIITPLKPRQEKLVAIFIDSKEYEFTGNWSWELRAEAVYCSDVMLHLPTGFEGTLGIIHPDDKQMILDRIATSKEVVPFLQFRLITTYGEVKVLTGKALQFCEVPASFQPVQSVEAPLRESYGLSRQAQKLQWQLRSAALAEGSSKNGSWYYNTATLEMWYSDGMYRIYGLPVQSLNAHLHTFSSLIHPDDKEMLNEALGKAIQQLLPLHVDYRIIAANGIEKQVRLVTHWEFNDKGAQMLYGSLADVTGQYQLEQQAEKAGWELSLKSKILQLHEQVTNTGYWYINLLTRKVVYSDYVYRLHGLKPKSVAPGINIFLNYIHPDDREIVKEISKKIVRNHEPPDVDFRVIRHDGALRYLRQKGKLIVYGDGEMAMLVSLQDITRDKIVERKNAEWNTLTTVGNFIQHQLEQKANMGSWVWEVESGNITWSDGLFHLLGYKSNATTLTYKALLRFIHADDRSAFTDGVELALREKKETAFSFRLIRRGEQRHIEASFKLVANTGNELFVALLRDVTEVQKMQEGYAKQLQLAQSISSNIQDTLFITDENNNIIHWNKAAENQFGLAAENVLHQNFFEVVPALKEEATLHSFNQALKGQVVAVQAARTLSARAYHNQKMIPLFNNEGLVSSILHLISDVTKEQDMQHRLTERFNFIESLLEASVDRIVALDNQMNYLYCNTKAAAHFGLPKEELLGKNVLEVFPASISGPSYEYFRKALQGETVFIPAIEGMMDEHYGRIYLVPIKNSRDEVSALLWIRQDLSNEIKWQRQLKKSDDILNSITTAFIELDEAYRFRYLNPSAAAYFGRSSDELLGKVMWEEYPDALHSEGYKAITSAVARHEKMETEFLSPLFKRWIFMSVTPTSDGVIVLISDKTDLTKTKEILKEEHRQMKEAQAIGSIGSFEWKVGAEMVRWSDEMYRINGMVPQSVAITAAKIDSLIYPQDWEALEAIKQQCLNTPGAYKHVHRIVNPDGTIKWVNHQFESVTDASGNIERVYGTLQDITAQVLQEEELKKMARSLEQIARELAEKKKE